MSRNETVHIINFTSYSNKLIAYFGFKKEIPNPFQVTDHLE
jgi:hypothetical protein